MSRPKSLVFWETSWISLTPRATSRRTSSAISATGRLRCLPRISGMRQKVQLKLQPSPIFTKATWGGVSSGRSSMPT